MVVNNDILHQLQEVGLTEYEAKAYAALLGSSPATAYETAKSAGIPTSKIYEVLAKLAERGMVSEQEDEDKRKYLPQPPDEFIESYRSRMGSTLKGLKLGLNEIGREAAPSFIWNIRDYDYLMDKAARMISGAKETLLVSVWPEEMEFIYKSLESAHKAGVMVSVIHFGKIEHPVGLTLPHPIEDTLYSEKGGRGLAIVADSREVLMGNITNDLKAEGAISQNKGFVVITEDYIKHDIYIMKIIQRFDGLLIDKFGENYKKLRDVFHDEEI